MQSAGQSLVMVDGLPLRPIEKVRQTARYIMGGIDQQSESAYYFMIVIHAAIMENMGQADTRYFAGAQVPVETMVSILREGQRAGEVREGDAYGFALIFFSAIMGLAVYKLTMPGFKMPDPEILVDMVKKE